ncbi:hypothetical protein [Starkeya nomas]|nr:hypothetical protein [Starkeya nomas]
MRKRSSKIEITSEQAAGAAANGAAQPQRQQVAKMVAASAPTQRFNNK